MINKILISLFITLTAGLFPPDSCLNKAEEKKEPISIKQEKKITTGAEQLELYLPALTDKNIALVVNQTSIVGNTHLVDTLSNLKINIKKIFAPEHGFRGTADAGEHINNSTDTKTGIPIISLYGNNKKPSNESLKGIDIVIFDIQDVGARFYTFISTMHYVMQACADNNIQLIILDRPNPNGYYINGPVLEMKYKSFVGMHPIPIVHALTIGELAMMINGEKWLDSNRVCSLQVVKVKDYSHKNRYTCPVKPSPNLPNNLAIQFYPYLCLFEGTVVSVGRGTQWPFQVIGAPGKHYGTFSFTPTSTSGSKSPMYENQLCHGVDLKSLYPETGFRMRFLLDMYHKCTEKDKFFNDFFNKLAGNASFQEQIKKGMSEAAILESWRPAILKYKEMRKKYLLYEDFE